MIIGLLKWIKPVNIKWSKTIGGNSKDELGSFAQIDKRNFIIGGLSASGISGDKTESSRGKADYWIVYLNK